MGNKQILAQNNETLASILSNVLGLPSQESCKHGAYVWKKYEIKNYSVQFVRLANKQVQVVPTNITYNELTLSMLNNRVVCVDSNYNYIIKDGDLHWIKIGSTTSSGNISLTYDNSNGTITIGNNSFQETYEYQSFSDTYNSFIDYVVSDSPTAYPDGGEQGGYWYEKVVEGISVEDFGYTKYAIDKITFTSDTSTASVDINHSLGEEPKEVMIYAVNPENITNNSQIISFHASSGVSGSAAVAVFKRYYSYADSKRSYITDNASLTKYADKITVGITTSYKFKGGMEYTLITMA